MKQKLRHFISHISLLNDVQLLGYYKISACESTQQKAQSETDVSKADKGESLLDRPIRKTPALRHVGGEGRNQLAIIKTETQLSHSSYQSASVVEQVHRGMWLPTFCSCRASMLVQDVWQTVELQVQLPSLLLLHGKHSETCQISIYCALLKNTGALGGQQ